MPIDIQNLSKSFDQKSILKNFSFHFEDKGLYILVGESGIGKTTLLRIIAGLELFDEGTVSGLSRCSYAFQEHRLFPWLTALENVVFSISERNDKADIDKSKNMLLRLQLKEDDMNLKPDQMSGGMKQRVSLARAFLYDAPILLLDEPTKELDEKNAAIVRDLITENSKNRLVIMVSHQNIDTLIANASVIQL